MLRRIAFRSLVFLVLGAVATVGVAWLCGWVVKFDPATPHSTVHVPPHDGSNWYGMTIMHEAGAAHVWIRTLSRDEWAVFADALGDRNTTRRRTTFDVLWRRWGGEPTWWPSPPQSVEAFCAEREPHTEFQFAARGWPVLSMWTALNDATVDHAIDLGSANTPGTFATTRRVLPFRPIVIGFAIDTVFYASILWAIFKVPGMAKRRWRRRSNRCEHCGYPIGTNPVCTECGRILRR